MDAKKVEKFIKDKIESQKVYYPKQVFKDIEVNVYNGSFGSITITISNKLSYVSGYVGNYDAVSEKVSDFLHRAQTKLFADYWYKHHKA